MLACHNTHPNPHPQPLLQQARHIGAFSLLLPYFPCKRLCVQAKRAERQYVRALQRTALHSWTAFYAARTAKRQQWLAALMFCSRQRLRRSLLHWRDAAHTAAAVRRAVGVEADALPDVEQVQQEQLPAPPDPRRAQAGCPLAGMRTAEKQVNLPRICSLLDPPCASLLANHLHACRPAVQVWCRQRPGLPAE